MKKDQLGFAPIVLLLVIIILSGGVIGGSVYIKSNNPELVQKISHSLSPTNSTPSANTTSLPINKLAEATHPPTPNNQTPSPFVLTDKDKIDYLGKVAHMINLYYKSNNKLPTNLDETSYKQDGQYYPGMVNFISTDLKYIVQPNDGYLFCSILEHQTEDLPTAYFLEKVENKDLPVNYQCFSLAPFKDFAIGVVKPPVKYESGVKTIKDSNIDSVKTDVVYTLGDYTTSYTLVGNDETGKLISRSNDSINKEVGFTKEHGFYFFPYGFFSENPEEWGMIGDSHGDNTIGTTNSGKPINVTITFKQPIKLSKISNLFSNCQIVDCYSWEAKGVTSDKTSVPLGKVDKTGKDSKTYSTLEISSTGQFKELVISVTRTHNVYELFTVWKKIKLEYK